jgi:hypothetical protein
LLTRGELGYLGLARDEFLSLSGSKSTLAKPAVARDGLLSLKGSKSHLA